MFNSKTAAEDMAYVGNSIMWLYKEVITYLSMP